MCFSTSVVCVHDLGLKISKLVSQSVTICPISFARKCACVLYTPKLKGRTSIEFKVKNSNYFQGSIGHIRIFCERLIKVDIYT
jgi:hypothetical protein